MHRSPVYTGQGLPCEDAGVERAAALTWSGLPHPTPPGCTVHGAEEAQEGRVGELPVTPLIHLLTRT